MAKVKHTKTELKTQRDSLRRYERFLPMLQLKKQQLQVELQAIQHRIDALRADEAALLTDADRWVALFASPGFDASALLTVASVDRSETNIAGVTIPVLEGVTFARAELDLFETPAWLDDAQDLLARLVELSIGRAILEEQARLVAAELRTTSQRVNLFEKIKIPESRENIRVIKIFLGDQQTAEVARAKTAKNRGTDIAEDGALHGLPMAAVEENGGPA